MSYINPNSDIYVLHDIPLDPTQDNTLWFANLSAQTSYFTSKAKYQFTKQTYQRVKRGYIRLQKRAEDLYDCNYLMFRNTAYGTKWFYAFLDSVDYINDSVCEVRYTIDPMQTWFFDYLLEKFGENEPIMSNEIEFEDYSIRVTEAIEECALQFLEEAAVEIESQAVRNSRVKSGKLKGSWKHQVDEGAKEATVGSPEQNAIWEELGTGEHALEGNGRKGGWSYKDAKGDWHFTHGKKPSRAFWKSYTSMKGSITKRIMESMKGL